MANFHITEYNGGILVSYASQVQKGWVVVDIRDGDTVDVHVHSSGVVGSSARVCGNVHNYHQEVNRGVDPI